jgi:acylglycerol lipase
MKGKMMTGQTASFKTPDGVTIYTESWLPDGSSKAVVLIVNGLAEHTGRYAHVAAKLTPAGYAVYSLDHRGQGKSDGLRAYFEDFQQPLDDLKQFLDIIKAEQPGKHIFIYGHSLGALISLVFLLRYQAEFAGAIISGAPLEVEGSQPKMLITMGNVLNSIAPKMAITPLDSKWLSHDPAIVTGYDNDPLVHRGNVRVRMGYHIVHVSRDVKAHMAEITLPILIIHGSEDKICPPSGSTVLNQGVGASDKTLKIYPGFYHEVHNEVEKETVLNDILAWLNAHA